MSTTSSTWRSTAIRRSRPTIPGALLDPACDTLSWTPNFTAAANEDHKGYAALLADAAAAIRGEENGAPGIEDGVLAMERLERMIAQIEG